MVFFLLGVMVFQSITREGQNSLWGTQEGGLQSFVNLFPIQLPLFHDHVFINTPSVTKFDRKYCCLNITSKYLCVGSHFKSD